MKRAYAAILAAFGAASLVAGMAAPAMAAPTGQEHFTIVFTHFGPDGDSGTAFVSGPVTGAGTGRASEGETFPASITVPQGTLSLLVTSGPDTSENAVPSACFVSFSGTDTLQVTGGTGVFTGAKGTGADTTRGALAFGRNADGSCNFDAGPVSGFVLVTGTVNLS
jgi:hypothetical protein